MLSVGSCWFLSSLRDSNKFQQAHPGPIPQLASNGSVWGFRHIHISSYIIYDHLIPSACRHHKDRPYMNLLGFARHRGDTRVTPRWHYAPPIAVLPSPPSFFWLVSVSKVNTSPTTWPVKATRHGSIIVKSCIDNLCMSCVQCKAYSVVSNAVICNVKTMYVRDAEELWFNAN